MNNSLEMMQAAKPIIMDPLKEKAQNLGIDENILFVACFILGVNRDHADLYAERLHFDNVITNSYLELMVSDFKVYLDKAVQEHGTLKALEAAKYLKRLSPAELEGDTERRMLYFAFEDFLHELNGGKREVYPYQLEVISKGLTEIRKIKALYNTSLTETILILCKDEVIMAADTRLMIETGFTSEDMTSALTFLG